MNKKNSYWLSLFLFILFPFSIKAVNPFDRIKKQNIQDNLQTPYFEKLYANTYYSLVERMDKKGYLPESLTGAYSGMFPRTTGAYILLMLETEQYDKAELTLDYVLKTLNKNEIEYVPRVIGANFDIEDDQFQIDAQAHIILGWSRLALSRGRTSFEDNTWKQMRAMMKLTVSRAFFLYGHWAIEQGLVRNIAFEHSKDARMWDTFDLLTQSFVGAALYDMIQIAKRQGDDVMAEQWSHKLDLLSEGINKNLTTNHYGITTYSEMRLPDSNSGVPYNGLGWVTLSPIAAGWEGADHQILKNTVQVMNDKLLQHSNGVYWMPTDGYPDGTFSNEIIGKGIGWEIVFATKEKDYNRLIQILHMIEVVNDNHPIYMEGAWLQGENYWQNKRLSSEDIPQMKNTEWQVKDAGNGEQTAWWCWAMAYARKSLGLSPQPKMAN